MRKSKKRQRPDFTDCLIWKLWGITDPSLPLSPLAKQMIGTYEGPVKTNSEPLDRKLGGRIGNTNA